MHATRVWIFSQYRSVAAKSKFPSEPWSFDHSYTAISIERAIQSWLLFSFFGIKQTACWRNSRANNLLLSVGSVPVGGFEIQSGSWSSSSTWSVVACAGSDFPSVFSSAAEGLMSVPSENFFFFSGLTGATSCWSCFEIWFRLPVRLKLPPSFRTGSGTRSLSDGATSRSSLFGRLCFFISVTPDSLRGFDLFVDFRFFPKPRFALKPSGTSFFFSGYRTFILFQSSFLDGMFNPDFLEVFNSSASLNSSMKGAENESTWSSSFFKQLSTLSPSLVCKASFHTSTTLPNLCSRSVNTFCSFLMRDLIEGGFFSRLVLGFFLVLSLLSVDRFAFFLLEDSPSAS